MVCLPCHWGTSAYISCSKTSRIVLAVQLSSSNSQLQQFSGPAHLWQICVVQQEEQPKSGPKPYPRAIGKACENLSSQMLQFWYQSLESSGSRPGGPPKNPWAQNRLGCPSTIERHRWGMSRILAHLMRHSVSDVSALTSRTIFSVKKGL